MLFLLQVTTYAQEKQATKLFERGQYSRAARLYEEALKKDSTGMLVINNLAHCYRAEKRYTDAERMFRKTLAFSEPFSLNRYHHAEMHFLLGQYEQAEQLLQEFLFVVPDNDEAKRLLENCGLVSQWPESEIYEVISLRNINSPYADFSPVVFKNGLVFTTERKHDSGEAEFAIEDKPFLSIYQADFSNAAKTSFWEPRLFSSKLSSPFHEGPACFNKSEDKIYFTQVQQENSRIKTIPMKIFMAEWETEKWSKPQSFELNSNEYSVGHPALSADEKIMIFSSNMPGGYGGMDLYITRKEGETWSQPKNLGAAVNTYGEEVFPTILNNYLYFSSTGLPGYGGLDLFVIHLDSLSDNPQNLLKPINSAWDDLSITFITEQKAYFSSDRPGGMGRDDIYGLVRIALDNEHRQLSGLLEYRNQPAAYATIALKDHAGAELQKITTDEQGKFAFEYLKSQKEYELDIGLNDPEKIKEFEIYLLNSKEEKVQRISAGADGKFIFELLKPDDHDNLPLIDIQDQSLLALEIRGQVYENEPGDYQQRVEILLMDINGKVISRTFTDIDGQFLFKNIFPDDQYIFRLAAENPNLKIVLVDLYGNVLQTIVRTGDDFVYTRLSPDDETISLINEHDVTIKVKLGQNFNIPHIYYDFDKWELNAQAKQQLTKLVTILQKNPHIKVEVVSHTDSRASNEYNLSLSRKRADSVVAFIRTAGISAQRISGMGMGEDKLVNHCANDVECTEEEHAQNRRTEFTISAK
jgi:outer membrane protein OmpA-like peptidoglycan-associated protein